MRAVLLLGSGISLTAGMPSVSEISNQVLSGDGWSHWSDDLYLLAPPQYDHAGIPDEHVPRVVAFLKLLKEQADLYFTKYSIPRSPNYEDLYYLVTQIHDSIYGEFDNPAIEPLIEKILPSLEPLFVRKETEIVEWRFDNLTWETKHYLHDLVSGLVSRRPNSLHYLSWIGDALRDVDLVPAAFSLNHDTLLETRLDEMSVRFVDGFEQPVNGFRRWNSDLIDIERTNAPVFLKLHGSVNWYRFNSDRLGSVIGIASKGDFWHPEGPDGETLDRIEGRPLLLIGTFNKLWQYSAGIFAELYFQFRLYLKTADTLIACGYGFGDKGINTQIAEWMWQTGAHKLIIIDPQMDSLREQARPAIGRNWENWREQGRLVEIPKGVEEVSWEQVKTV